MRTIEVYERKEIPCNCSTCLYQSKNGWGCAHADRQDDALKISLFNLDCPSWELDNSRFERA